VFQSLHGGIRLVGRAGSLLWGYHTAAALTTWRIAKNEAGQWILTATFARVDAFQCRQRPLLFTAPREGAHDGWWAWGVDGTIEMGKRHLRVRLGPPEQ
jgi:hypothetical protein